MTVYDITVPIQPGIPIWPGDESPEISRYTSLNQGDMTNTSRIHCSLHTATHVDAPLHLFEEGKTIDQLPLNRLMGKVEVIELMEVDRLSASILEPMFPSQTRRILFKTRNSLLWENPSHSFWKQFVSLTEDGAKFLVERGIQLVGIDYLSIDQFENEDLPAHKILLSNEVIIIEGLNLLEVPAGSYELICLPLKIVGADGAPARVVLRKP